MLQLLHHQEQVQLDVPVGAYNGSAEPRGVKSSKCVLWLENKQVSIY